MPIVSLYCLTYILVQSISEGRRDRIVVGFTTTCAISAYQH